MRVAIIGAGINGIFHAIKLLKNQKSIEVIIFEREELIGGRVRQFITKYGNDIDKGARVMNTSQDIYITFNKLYKNEWKKCKSYDSNCRLENLNNLLLKASKVMKHNKLQNLTWQQFVKSTLTKTEYNEYILLDYEFSEDEHRNAEQQLNIIINDSKGSRVIPKCDSMAKYIEYVLNILIIEYKLNIKTRMTISKVEKRCDKIELSFKECSQKGIFDKVISSVALPDAKKIFHNIKPINKYLDNYFSIPSHRLYFEYKISPNGHSINDNIFNKSLNLPYYIDNKILSGWYVGKVAENSKGVVYQVMYGNGELSNIIKNMSTDVNYECEIYEMVRDVLHHHHNIILPKPDNIYTFYWESASHGLKKDRKLNVLNKNVFFENGMIEISGELTSLNMGWMNGAFENM